MADHLGHRDVHDKILGAIERVVATGTVMTPDLGGSSTTKDVADAIVGEI
jgi:tartrate dehydrogenase/decarboxylase/D-malate dehydrogenase